MAMKRLVTTAMFLIVVLSISASAHFHHYERPFQLVLGGKYGFMDAHCRLVIPPQYSEASQFKEGLAAVKVGDKWGYVNSAGATIIQPQFAFAEDFSGGLASVKLDEKSPLFGFINKNGRVVIKPQFGMPLWFSEGLVEGYGEENGILNVPLGYVNSQGEYVIRLEEPGQRIEFLTAFSEGLAGVSMQVEHSDGSIEPAKWGFIDHTGKWSIPRSYSGAGEFHEGLAAVQVGDLWGYVDKANRFVIAPHFNGALEFSDGLAAVKLGNLWGYIDHLGTVVIPARFESPDLFRSGMAGFGQNRHVGYINKGGEIVVPANLVGGSEFIDGFAAVSDELGYLVIDTAGQTVCRLMGHVEPSSD
jgi:serine/threonine-protein kinase